MKKKMLKIFLVELFAVSILFGVFYYSKNSHIFNFANIQGPGIFKKLSLKDVSMNMKIDLEEEILVGLLNGNEIISIRDKAFLRTPDDIFKIISNITKDNAEIMYYSGVEYSNGTLRIKYTRPRETLKNDQISVRVKRDEIIANIIDDSMSDYEKVKAIHDYVINNSDYDMDLYNKGKVEEESYTAYGTLVLGVSVCEGYAKAMKYLLDETGIENMVVIGESRDQNHAWNLVKLDGDYYHIDATWNDPISEDGENVLRYNYFNLSDNEISKTHSWDRDEYPEAVGQYYNYFKYNDLIINSEMILINRIQEILSNRKHSIVFKYENYNEQDFSINRIIEDIAYENPRSIRLHSYSYSVDDEHVYFIFNFIIIR